jgi:hypothetical protein
MIRRVLIVTAASWFVALPAHAAGGNVMYECPDANGGRQFTNVPDNPKACKALNIQMQNTAPPPPAGAPAQANVGRVSPARPAATPTPAGFPRVDRETQASRDGDRRRILENELANEQRALDDAKRDLAAQESQRLGDERNYQRVLDRLEPFKKKVKQHQDNVDSIRREIASTR